VIEGELATGFGRSSQISRSKPVSKFLRSFSQIKDVFRSLLRRVIWRELKIVQYVAVKAILLNVSFMHCMNAPQLFTLEEFPEHPLAVRDRLGSFICENELP